MKRKIETYLNCCRVNAEADKEEETERKKKRNK